MRKSKKNKILLTGLMMLLFSGCSNVEMNETVIKTLPPESTPIVTKSVEYVWQDVLNIDNNVFNDKIQFVAMEIIGSGENIKGSIISDDSYNSLTLYDFGNNFDYTVEIVIVPKNSNVSLELASLSINEEGNVVVNQILDSGINEPFRFRYDDFESITPQYGIIIENTSNREIIPIVHSGMDGSLAMNSDYSKVIDS